MLITVTVTVLHTGLETRGGGIRGNAKKFHVVPAAMIEAHVEMAGQKCKCVTHSSHVVTSNTRDFYFCI